MIPVPSSARVWIATGVTDMRRGINGLALLVQEGLGRDPHAGDLYVFRGRRGDLIRCLWHDGLGPSHYAKRLEKGRFLWPTPFEGAVAITSAQLGYLLEGLDWCHPQRTLRPAAAGDLSSGLSATLVAPKANKSALMAAMIPAGSSLPDDIAALKHLVLAREAELAAAQAEIVQAKARENSAEAMILPLRLVVEKMRRELYGQRSERGARLLDQMELELEELEASVAEDDLTARAVPWRVESLGVGDLAVV